MNKARRHELKMLKFLRRMKVRGYKRQSWLNPDSRANLFAFRSHGHPCSCWCCSPLETKYKRAEFSAVAKKEIKEELSLDPYDESAEAMADQIMFY